MPVVGGGGGVNYHASRGRGQLITFVIPVLIKVADSTVLEHFLVDTEVAGEAAAVPREDVVGSISNYLGLPALGFDGRPPSQHLHRRCEDR